MSETDPDILDLAYLRRQTSGDPALERELLRLLVGQCESLLPVLVSTDEETGRREAAHGLRGAAAALGARRLAAAAAAIEAGGGSAQAVASAIAELRALIERLLSRDAA